MRYLPLFAAVALAAQAPEEPVRIGPGITAPKLLRKVEPKYSAEAQKLRIQGTVMLEIVVATTGRATEMTVLSPLGFGLDEQARAALAQWKFTPGQKDGRPVPIRATVQVNFRIPKLPHDEKAERRRTQYNVAIQGLGAPDSDPLPRQRAIAAMQQLAVEGFPPALHAVGTWKRTGEHLAKDEAGGLELLRKAAAMDHGPSCYELARLKLETDPGSAEGLAEMERAASLGSAQAQYFLGGRPSAAAGDRERAVRYLRLCAAAQVAACQFRLGRLLLDSAAHREPQRLEGIAWLALAAERGMAESGAAADAELARLTPEQREWVRTLQRQLGQAGGTSSTSKE